MAFARLRLHNQEIRIRKARSPHFFPLALDCKLILRRNNLRALRVGDFYLVDTGNTEVLC